jgi:hypothetical protein
VRMYVGRRGGHETGYSQSVTIKVRRRGGHQREALMNQ